MRPSQQDEIDFNMNNHVYQVFFLPYVLDAPSRVLAYCPFTGIMADGDDEQDAAGKWHEEAARRFHDSRRFDISGSLTASCKVWYSELQGHTTPTSTSDSISASDPSFSHVPSSSPASLFMIDHYEYCAPRGNDAKAVLICPQTKETLEGTKAELQQVETVPTSWFDWKVTCTPKLVLDDYTLTPNYIN
eukprot:TRINITY_DN4846_c0_g1_i2.p1 TRINITY_DN4846_c0_g1~~TRINITY_DN4846_c0_g1_i2.p1  ORF type:complete len:197 (+),score=44.73 TRINITY_DN4846_c0_g1_i2:27-593(+)